MINIGFLHTADVHVESFRQLVRDVAPGCGDLHRVDSELLEDARRHGVDDGVRARLRKFLHELAADGSGVVVCTCSTLAADAERMSSEIGVPVLRVDRPMAEAAVAGGGRVAIVVAVESTLRPTLDLLRDSADAAGVHVDLIEAPCLDAWSLFESGHHDGCVARIAAHAREFAAGVDVIVLAQASMAPAAALLKDLAIPVLSSPRPAVMAAASLVRIPGHGR